MSISHYDGNVDSSSNDILVKLSLDAEQEKYARMEEIFRLKREEDQLRFEKRQARRSQVVQERRCNNAAVFRVPDLSLRLFS